MKSFEFILFVKNVVDALRDTAVVANPDAA